MMEWKAAAVKRINDRIDIIAIQRNALKKQMLEIKKKFDEDWNAYDMEVRSLDEEKRLLNLGLGRW